MIHQENLLTNSFTFQLKNNRLANKQVLRPKGSNNISDLLLRYFTKNYGTSTKNLWGLSISAPNRLKKRRRQQHGLNLLDFFSESVTGLWSNYCFHSIIIRLKLCTVWMFVFNSQSSTFYLNGFINFLFLYLWWYCSSSGFFIS